jgi:hypothetical protein
LHRSAFGRGFGLAALELETLRSALDSIDAD